MAKAIVLNEDNGVVYASSRQVAKDFGKRHDHTLESVRDIIKNLSPENSGVRIDEYFIESQYVSRGKKYVEYRLTKDGFLLLAMGFTGVKALEFKMDYINQFKLMEAQLREIDSKINVHGNLSDDDYAEIKFKTAQRLRKAFLNSQDIFKDYERFVAYSTKTMSVKKRNTRLDQIVDTLKVREEGLYREKQKGYRAERENINELVEIILRDINEMNKRSYGTKLGYAKNKKSDS
ncbi:Rha family transcriptional regulator [Alkalihalophilus marmarensis]|uniref:Rha family transcriptional regulator n=1 Tax=Alkalihalophilus marmarensis TaxID=521377 RepID=UPI002E24C46E|nr:Rha family transcriptional regulator [Alkalihalophilus marmarensis]